MGKLIEVQTKTRDPVAKLHEYLVPENDPLFPLIMSNINNAKKVNNRIKKED